MGRLFILKCSDTNPIVSAFLHSFAAVTLFVVGVGAVYVPLDRWRESRLRRVTVIDCHVPAGEQTVVSLVREQEFRSRSGLQAKLTLHDLGGQRATQEIAWPGAAPVCMAASHDRRRLFVGTSDGGIHSLPIDGSMEEPSRLGRHEGPCADQIAATPDDSLVVSLAFRSLYAWNVADRSLVWSRSDLDVNAFAIASSATMLCGTNSGEILEVSVRTGKTIRLLARHRATIRHVAVKDDTLIALDGDGKALLFHRLADNKTWRKEPSGPIYSGNTRMSIAPDGRRAVGTTKDSLGLVCWNLEEGRPICEFAGHAGIILGTAFLSEGTLMSWGTDGTICVWHLAHGALRVVARIRPLVAG